MRYLFGIGAGALLATLPPLLLVLPEIAWLQACTSVALASSKVQGIGEVVEVPCGLMHDTLQPLWVRLLVLSVLAIGCATSGALAARISERRPLAVALAAPFLGYFMLIYLSRPTVPISSFELASVLAVSLMAGLLGASTVGWQHLTNAWRATRSKQRAPQA
jgi:hypothetical protein